MDSRNQFTVFCLCVATGFVGGVIYEIFSFLRLIMGCRCGKNKFLGCMADVIFCVCFALHCIFASFLFHFPNLRVYMCIGYALGGIIYLKSLHIILAFLQNVCYNKITKVVKKAKKREKTLKKEGETI